MPTRALTLLLMCAVTTGCVSAVPVAGLRPESPKASHAVEKVASLQPTLRWERFPRPHDAVPETVSDVRYDLRIWRQHDDGRVELAYERRELPQPSHTIETPLRPRTDYLWSVRARFLLDGWPRVIQWSAVLQHDGQWLEDQLRTERLAPEGSVPLSQRTLYQHHRFKTPREEKR